MDGNEKGSHNGNDKDGLLEDVLFRQSAASNVGIELAEGKTGHGAILSIESVVSKLEVSVFSTASGEVERGS